MLLWHALQWTRVVAQSRRPTYCSACFPSPLHAAQFDGLHPAIFRASSTEMTASFWFATFVRVRFYLPRSLLIRVTVGFSIVRCQFESRESGRSAGTALARTPDCLFVVGYVSKMDMLGLAYNASRGIPLPLTENPQGRSKICCWK